MVFSFPAPKFGAGQPSRVDQPRVPSASGCFSATNRAGQAPGAGRVRRSIGAQTLVQARNRACCHRAAGFSLEHIVWAEVDDQWPETVLRARRQTAPAPAGGRAGGDRRGERPSSVGGTAHGEGEAQCRGGGHSASTTSPPQRRGGPDDDAAGPFCEGGAPRAGGTRRHRAAVHAGATRRARDLTRQRACRMLPTSPCCAALRAPVYSYWPVTPLRSSPAVPASMARCSPGASRASSSCRRCRSARARTRLPCCTNSMPR